MTPERWNLTGVVGVVVLAMAWLVWGHTSSGQRIATARSDVIGSWTITQLEGEPPGGTAYSRVDVEQTHGALSICAFASYDADGIFGSDDYEVGTWTLIPVVGDATSWDAPTFRIILRNADEIELTGRADTDADPPWRARGARRQP